MQATTVVKTAANKECHNNGGNIQKGKGTDQTSWLYSGRREMLNIIGLDSSHSSVATL